MSGLGSEPPRGPTGAAGGFTLSELELDALTELVNIGVSRAATSLGAMVGQQVLLSVPSVAIVSRARAMEQIGETRQDLLVAVRQVSMARSRGGRC